MCSHVAATGHRQLNGWAQVEHGSVQQATVYCDDTRLRKSSWLRQRDPNLNVVNEEHHCFDYNGQITPFMVPVPSHELDSDHNLQAPLQPSYDVGAPKYVGARHVRPSTSDLSLPEVTVTRYPNAPLLPATSRIGSPSLWQQLAPSIEAIMAAPGEDQGNTRSHRRSHRRASSGPNCNEPPIAGSFELPASSSPHLEPGRSRYGSIPSLDVLANQLIGRPREVDTDTVTLSSYTCPADPAGKTLPHPLRIYAPINNELPVGTEDQRKLTQPTPNDDLHDLHLESAPSWLSKYTYNATSDSPLHYKPLDTNGKSFLPLPQATTTFDIAPQIPSHGITGSKPSAANQKTVSGYLTPPNSHSARSPCNFLTNAFTSRFSQHARPQAAAASAQGNVAGVEPESPHHSDSIAAGEGYSPFSSMLPPSNSSPSLSGAYPAGGGYGSKILPAEQATGGISRARKRAEKKQRKGNFMDRLFGLRRE